MSIREVFVGFHLRQFAFAGSRGRGLTKNPFLITGVCWFSSSKHRGYHSRGTSATADENSRQSSGGDGVGDAW
jgi:hypothetical protein